MKSTTVRYGYVAVAIHWLTAILVLVLLISGFRSGFSEEAAVKQAALRVHLPAAFGILVLTVLRLAWWRFWDRKPAPVDGTSAAQETVARWVHRLLYLGLLVLLASGIGLSVLSGLPSALFADAPMPQLDTLPPRGPHGAVARLVLALILLHGAAALYHHFVLRDRTLTRMWFGRR